MVQRLAIRIASKILVIVATRSIKTRRPFESNNA